MSMSREGTSGSILIAPSAMPHIRGVAIPGDLYWVARTPAPLAGMRYPAQDFPWREVANAGFMHVVRLTSSSAAYDPSPLRMLFTTDLEDLHRGVAPTNPAHEVQFVRDAAKAVRAATIRGEGVVVHCEGGRGRTGMVLAAVFVGLGLPAAEVTAYLDHVHKARGTSGWPESSWQADALRQFDIEHGGRP